MRPKSTPSCSYIVPIDAAATTDEIRVLAGYLSTLGPAGCEVIAIDSAPPESFEQRRRILRWVGRHVAAKRDFLEVAVEVASTDKIILAAPDSRYTVADVSAICGLLDGFEAVEPEEFVEPMPWWGAIDAGRMLLQRGLEKGPGRGRTCAFRRSAWKPLFAAELQPAKEVFVRHEPPRFAAWLRARTRAAALPLETAAFACILPLLVILAVLGGIGIAGGYAGVVTLASVLVAVRGRAGASRFFPLRACLFAPLAIVERSLSVYCSLFRGRSDFPERALGKGNDIIGAHAPTRSGRPGPLHRPPSLC
ncbi:MAG TPA: hypothetical protein VM779_15700 [Thermoanaerobaculia bacterium]|nr:hypothetical protein [Thermoanaerobaculia bacterium]